MKLNHLGRSAPGAPVFLYHSILDELIPFATARQLFADWCLAGTAVSFYPDALSEHSSQAVRRPLAGHLPRRPLRRPAGADQLPLTTAVV